MRRNQINSATFFRWSQGFDSINSMIVGDFLRKPTISVICGKYGVRNCTVGSDIIILPRTKFLTPPKRRLWIKSKIDKHSSHGSDSWASSLYLHWILDLKPLGFAQEASHADSERLMWTDHGRAPPLPPRNVAVATGPGSPLPSPRRLPPVRRRLEDVVAGRTPGSELL
jgi:hypothetical protein